MEDVTVSFNLNQGLAMAFVSLLVMFGTKMLIAFGYLFFGPKLDGQSFWGFLGLGGKAALRLPLTIVVAVAVGFVITSAGGGLQAVLAASIFLAVVFSFV